jgi:hypothetical protein
MSVEKPCFSELSVHHVLLYSRRNGIAEESETPGAMQETLRHARDMFFCQSNSNRDELVVSSCTHGSPPLHFRVFYY